MSMEAERINQIDQSLQSLRKRVDELRGFL
jgi:hypothetical protein